MKKLLIIFYIFCFINSIKWKEVEREFIHRGLLKHNRFDTFVLYDILTDMKDDTLKLVFLIKIMIINFEIECSSEMASNYYQSLYKKKDTFSIRLDVASFLNYDRYNSLKNTVLDTGDLEGDVEVSVNEYKTFVSENNELEKIFFEFLKIDNDDDDKFEKLGPILAELLQNTDDIQYSEIIYLIYLFMDRTSINHIYYIGENLVDGNDIKIENKEYPIRYIKSYYMAELEGKKIDEEDRIVVDFFKKKFYSVKLLKKLNFFKPFFKKVMELNSEMAEKILILIIYTHFTQFNGLINDFHWIIDYQNTNSNIIQDYKSAGFNFDVWFPKLFNFIKDGFIKHALFNMNFYDDFTKKFTKVGRFIGKIWLVTKIVAGLLLPYVNIVFGACEIFDHYINKFTVQYEYNEIEYLERKKKNLKERYLGSTTINLVSEFQRMTVLTERFTDNYFNHIYNQLGPDFEMIKKYHQRKFFKTWSLYISFHPKKLDIMEVAKKWKLLDIRIRKNWINVPSIPADVEANEVSDKIDILDSKKII